MILPLEDEVLRGEFAPYGTYITTPAFCLLFCTDEITQHVFKILLVPNRQV